MGLVRRRQGVWYIAIRPYGKQVWISSGTANKHRAQEIERQLLVACKSMDFSFLDPEAKAVAYSLFKNQGWKTPDGASDTPETELTLWKAVEIFMNYPDIVGSKTRQRYQFCLVKLIDFFTKNQPVKAIWIPEIKTYQQHRLRQGASPGTINREVSTLSKLFSVLVELQYVVANPARMTSRFSEKSGEREVYISHRDIMRIVEQCPEWHQAIVKVAYYTGMRRGEILGLKWNQVNIATRILTFTPDGTKEGQWKRVPIHRDLLPIFESAARVRSLHDDHVFLLNGHIPSRDSVKNPWRKAVARIGFTDPRPRFHDLRHTWKTNARRSGMDPEIRERIMGHATKTKSVGERYGRISDNELVAAIDAMTFDHGETEILVAESRC